MKITSDLHLRFHRPHLAGVDSSEQSSEGGAGKLPAIRHALASCRFIEIQTPSKMAERLVGAVSQENSTQVLKTLSYPVTDPNRPCATGDTPLTHAIASKSSTMLDQLLRHSGIDPRAPRRDGLKPVEVASLKGNDAALRRWLPGLSSAELNAVGSDRRTLLTRAAASNSIAAVKTLLECPQVKVDRTDGQGNTAIQHAAREGHREVLELLLKHEPSGGWKRFDLEQALVAAQKGGHDDIAARLSGVLAGRDGGSGGGV
jgi:ankyrin repeat protein